MNNPLETLPWKPPMTKQHLFFVNNKLYNPTLQKWYTGLGFSFFPILSKLQAVGKLKTGTSHLKRLISTLSSVIKVICITAQLQDSQKTFTPNARFNSNNRFTFSKFPFRDDYVAFSLRVVLFPLSRVFIGKIGKCLLKVFNETVTHRHFVQTKRVRKALLSRNPKKL